MRSTEDTLSDSEAVPARLRFSRPRGLAFGDRSFRVAARVAAACARAWRVVLAGAVAAIGGAALFLLDPGLLEGLVERGSSFRVVI